MEQELIRLDKAVGCYKKHAVLGPLSLTIRSGEVVGIVGPNGSGKSTLLRLISGALHPCRKRRESSTGNSDAVEKRHATLTPQNIGFLFQHHRFTPTVPFSVEDVIYFGRAGVRGLGRRYTSRDHQAVDAAFAAMKLEAYRHRLYRELSGGEKQKTQFARLLAQEAQLLLLDEPTAGLDLDWQERVTALVDDLYRCHDKTVVMVTHDIDRLPSCCNRVVLLDHGEILADGPPAECLQSSNLEQMYGCPMEIIVRNGRYHAFSKGMQAQ